MGTPADRNPRGRGRSSDADGSPARYTRAELEALPVLAIGQADDLRIEDLTRGMRVWLSRTPPYFVEIERWSSESGWVTTDRYAAP